MEDKLKQPVLEHGLASGSAHFQESSDSKYFTGWTGIAQSSLGPINEENRETGTLKTS